MTARAAGGSGTSATLHATCVVIRDAGILIRGEAGSGKSTLAFGLLDRAARDGLHAGLVGDDRVRVALRHGRLVARPHPAIAGRIEIRGLGLREVPAMAAAVLRLVVDCVDAVPRLPEPAEPAVLLGVALQRVILGAPLRATGQGPAHVLEALSVASWSHSGTEGRTVSGAP